MNERNVRMLNLSCGTKVFVNHNNKIYQAVYKGFDFHFSHLCGGEPETIVFLYLGKECGEVGKSHSDWGGIYLTLDDFKRDENPIQDKRLSPQEFNEAYMRAYSINYDGHFTAWQNQKNQPINVMVSGVDGFIFREDKVQWLINSSGSIVHPSKSLYKTKEECVLNNKAKVVMLDEE